VRSFGGVGINPCAAFVVSTGKPMGAGDVPTPRGGTVENRDWEERFMKKRFVFLQLALLICLSVMYIPVHAASDDFIIEDGVLTKYNGNGGHVEIPNTVTRIDEKAFYGCETLTEVVIPDSVTDIGWYAFFGCTGLTDVVIPDSVERIGYQAFYACSSLKNVVIPGSVKNFQSAAFMFCENLTEAVISDGVTNIGSFAFCGCRSLTKIVIPDSVTKIGNDAFSDCENLTDVVITDSVIEIGEDVFIDTPWYEGLEDIAVVNGILLNYKSDSSHVVIPNGVRTIAGGVFKDNQKLTSVTIPNGVKVISDSTFHGCTELASVTLPDSLTSISGSFPFFKCTGLKNITFPDSLTTISGGFGSCTGLTSITLPDNLTTISTAFSDCTGLMNITFPDNLKMIGPYSFQNCTGLTRITLPNGLTTIDSNSFSGCTNLTRVTIPSSVEEIGYGVFDGCEHLTIYGEKGSFAESFAKTHQIPFSEVNFTKPTTDGFSDVGANSYYADAIKWAVAKGITQGTGNNLFQPNKVCNNGQILTFLWRANGSPTFKDELSPFTFKNKYYYQAALWAAAQNMIELPSIKSESPAPGVTITSSDSWEWEKKVAEVACTRATTVQYLWQSAGSPRISSTSQFSDVPSNAPYAAAVAWAIEKGITKGTTETTFSPEKICTRGQVVTFLYRARMIIN